MPHYQSFELLNIYEFEAPEGPRSFVCFLTPETADSKGVPDRAIVGEFEPNAEGEFDASTFQANTLFLEAFVQYMNAEAIGAPELKAKASENAGSVLALLDPRVAEPAEPPPKHEVMGWFHIDETGRPVPESFEYNADHVLFDAENGPSGILTDVQFYEWMHGRD